MTTVEALVAAIRQLHKDHQTVGRNRRLRELLKADPEAYKGVVAELARDVEEKAGVGR